MDNQLSTNSTATIHASVDITNCPITEPSPFNSCWYCHKMNEPGLRYKVALYFESGWILCVNGPYPCGSYTDLKILHKDLKDYLLDNKRVVVYDGYKYDETLYASKRSNTQVT